MISIITPVYNGQRYLKDCIQSVIDQNILELEHIIIDGASTDGSVAIIEDYASRYPHIRWISEKDRGQSDAMNKGLHMARGKVIGIINADDYYAPEAIREVLKVFENTRNPMLVVGNCIVLNHEGKTIEVSKPSNISFTRMLLDWGQGEFPRNPCAYFYHKHLHDKIGLYDIDEHYAMDLAFLLRASKCAHIHYVDRTFGFYRYLPQTKTFQAVENKTVSVDQSRVKEKFLRSLPPFDYWKIILQKYILTRWVYYSQKLKPSSSQELKSQG